MKFLIVLAFCVAIAAARGVEKPFAFIEDFEVDLDPRIIDGEIAGPGQFPHQVANKFSIGGSGSFCGASVICESWILTAAHCCQGGSKFLLYFGSVNQSQAVEWGRVVLRPTEIHVHPDYNDDLNHDICLMRLEQKLKYSDKIQPIPLATHRTDAGKRLTVSGWGRTSQNSPVSDFLRYVELDTISNKECEDVYGPNIIIDKTLCCKGRPHHSTCSGDSGGPLIETDPSGKLVQAAVVSFVHRLGCASGMPSGYVRVQSYLPWIRGTIDGTCSLPS